MTYRRSRPFSHFALPATLAAASALALVAGPVAARQTPALPSPPPVALASPPGPAIVIAASKSVAPGKLLVTAPKDGKYTFYTVLPGGRLGGLTDSIAGSYVVEKNAQSFAVLNAATGTVALYPVAATGGATKITVKPADFTRVRFVKVSVTGSGDGAANRRSAAVTVTDAAGQTTEQPISGAEAEELLFEHVPVGRATVAAGVVEASGTRRRVAKTVFVAPAKGGGPFTVSLTLGPAVAAGSVATGPVAVPGAPVVAPAPPPDAPRGNSWIAGVVGLAALVAGGFYGLRYAKARGFTVKDGLNKLGVEMPQDAPGLNAATGLKPVAPVAPPLPSLSDLPAAGPAARGGVGAASPFAPPAPLGAAVTTGAPRLAGVAGPVAGETFALDAQTPFTIGRDAANALSLAQDNTVSRRHARFAPSPGGSGWSVADDGSSNGVYVNGQRISAPQTLQAGDEIQVGTARFRFEGGAS